MAKRKKQDNTEINEEAEFLEKVNIAKAELKSIYNNVDIFLERQKFDKTRYVETSLKRLNYIISGKYSGDFSGVILGKFYNIYGMESLGKSALCLSIAKDFLDQKRPVLWIDGETTFDPDYAFRSFGVDVDNPLFSVASPDTAEQAFDTIKAFIKSGALTGGMYVVDSTTSLPTAEQFDSYSSKKTMGSFARLLSSHFSEVTSIVEKSLVAGFYINQIRKVSKGMFWVDDTTGGNPMKFYPHVSLLLKKHKEITKGDTYIGVDVEILAKKNKVSIPRLKDIFTLYPGKGFSKEDDIISLGIKCGYIKESGSWFAFGEHKIQGIQKLKDMIANDIDLREKLYNDILPQFNIEVDMTTGEILDNKDS